MKNYIEIATGLYPVTEEGIKNRDTGKSWKAVFEHDDFTELGFAEVVTSPRPTYNDATQGVREIAPTRLGGIYTMAWEVFVLSVDAIVEKQAAKDLQDRQVAKTTRAAVVGAIQVTTASGKTFDGDEISQGRMARGILGLQAAGVSTVTWVLADNTPVQVTVSELGEALALAGAAQAAAWVV